MTTERLVVRQHPGPVIPHFSTALSPGVGQGMDWKAAETQIQEALGCPGCPIEQIATELANTPLFTFGTELASVDSEGSNGQTQPESSTNFTLEVIDAEPVPYLSGQCPSLFLFNAFLLTTDLSETTARELLEIAPSFEQLKPEDISKNIPCNGGFAVVDLNLLDTNS